MTNNILEKSDVRFTISNDGWKRLNAGRKASDLIREAVSNTFDADGITEVRVRLEPGFVSIEDNSQVGIQDPSLVTTIFMTDKQDSPLKRGRKGRGLKELISAAEWAEVDTINFKTTFTDGRVVEKSDRTNGTKVSVKVSSWQEEDIDEAIVYLNRFIPPNDVNFYVNDVLVKRRRTRFSIGSVLKTQLVVDGIQCDEYRLADIDIVNLAKGETRGWIYEMGIPIQSLSTRFHINVLQRVPLNDNRDTVDYSYLSTLYSIILPEMLPSMSAQALKHPWVEMGLYNVSNDNAKLIVKKLFGAGQLAIMSTSSLANDVVKQHNYTLINANALGVNLDRAIRDVVKNADDIAESIEKDQIEEKVNELTVDPTGKLRRLVFFLGQELLGRPIDIEYFKRGDAVIGRTKIAHFRADIGVIGFNVNKFSFTNVLNPKILSTIVHEFAHNFSALHDHYFLENVERLSGELAALMLSKSKEIKLIAETSPRQMVLIQCTKCPSTRYVYPQDVHQVNKCVPCTKEMRKIKARERRILGV